MSFLTNLFEAISKCFEWLLFYQKEKSAASIKANEEAKIRQLEADRINNQIEQASSPDEAKRKAAQEQIRKDWSDF